jgi:FkbM family methyltransferase
MYNMGILKFNKKIYSYHYFVKKLIKKGDTIVDIGANLGYYSVLFAKWTGPKGKVIGVEPIHIYNKLYKEITAKFNNTTLYPYALGNEDKEIEMVAPNYDGIFHTGLPHVYNKRTDGNINDKMFRFTAKMVRPVELLSSIPRIDYIKCDVEGFEYTILHEMEEIIKKDRPIIQIEIWSTYEEKVNHLLNEIDYEPFKLHNGKLVRHSLGGKPIMDGEFIYLPKSIEAYR